MGSLYGVGAIVYPLTSVEKVHVLACLQAAHVTVASLPLALGKSSAHQIPGSSDSDTRSA